MTDRTTTGPYDVQPIKLCREDRRKLYGLLDADLPGKLANLESKLSRQDKLLAVLSFTNGLLLWKVLGSPTPPEVGTALVHLIS
jgi:hypothetical protein